MNNKKKTQHIKFVLPVLISIIFVLGFSINEAESHVAPVLTSAEGTPILDGVLTGGDGWPTGIPIFGTPSALDPSTLYVMNDGFNLFH